jgi:2',3'-cyclic-nucleotide 2'-phosphodiesterase (5'-nucleotidase family)
MLAGTTVSPIVDVARELVQEIDPKTDLVVLMTHVGLDEDKRLARNVPGIDVIVGGHSHTRLTSPVVENGVVIVQAGANCQNLGRLRLTVEDDRVVSHAGDLIELWPREGGRPEVRSLVQSMEETIGKEYGVVIGQLAETWDRSSNGESNVGNWLTDRMREAGGGDFAVLNSGGIRKDIAAGPLTKLEILEVLPFYNTLATFECTGEELLSIIRQNAKAAEGGERGILQVSGIRYAYEPRGGSIEIVEATVGGKPIDPGAIYRGVAVDFLIQGNSQRYFGFDPKKVEITGDLLSAVIIEAVEKAGTVESKMDGRIRKVGGERSAR